MPSSRGRTRRSSSVSPAASASSARKKRPSACSSAPSFSLKSPSADSSVKPLPPTRTAGGPGGGCRGRGSGGCGGRQRQEEGAQGRGAQRRAGGRGATGHRGARRVASLVLRGEGRDALRATARGRRAREDRARAACMRGSQAAWGERGAMGAGRVVIQGFAARTSSRRLVSTMPLTSADGQEAERLGVLRVAGERLRAAGPGWAACG